MKMKFALIGTIVTLCVTCFSIVGCQQDETETSMEQLPYLSLGPKITLSNPSPAEWETIRKAASRVNISIKDGLFYMEQTSGRQVNMSENLFTIFKEGVDRTNKRIVSGKIKISRSRSRWAGEYDEDNQGNDCLAQSIAYAIRRMGGVPNEPEIESWIISQYGDNGVPFDCLTEVLNLFLDGHEVSAIPTEFGWKSGNAIIVLQCGDQGHAVNLIEIREDGYVAYADPQRGEYGNATVSQIIYMFQID